MTTRIGTQMIPSTKGNLRNFLVEHVDAWNHEEMLGINTIVVQHSLCNNPKSRKIKQRQRMLSSERNVAIAKEVDRLRTVGFIQEKQYPMWLSNVVLVKK